MENKIIKINQNFEFRRVYRHGKFKANHLLVTYVIKNRYGKVRFGITATKKVGKAYLRNRAKRVITAAARENLKFIKGGYDIIFVARDKTPFAKSQQVAFYMEKQLLQILGDSFEKNTSHTS